MIDHAIRFARSITPARAFAAAAIAGAAGAHAQTALYSNGSTNPSTPALAPRTTTTSGVPAPNGAVWSEVRHVSATESNAIGGFSTHSTGVTGSYRFADDFTITGSSSWTLHSVSFYAYQSGVALGGSPFASVNVRIWRGVPGEPGSTIVFGDTTTNRLISCVPTNIYRVFNTTVRPAQAPSSSRVVHRTEVSLDSVTLTPGTYWIDWQYVATDPLLHAFSPSVTIDGSRGPAGANAMQFRPDGLGSWTTVYDMGKPSTVPDVPQDLPFILHGTSGCAADFNDDGAANSQDLFDFLGVFFVSDTQSDFNRDAAVNSQDFFDFLTAFFACS